MKDFKICCEEYDFSSLSPCVLPEIKGNCPVSCEAVIVSEEEIQKLNKDIRHTDAVTDVLSFPTLEGIKGKALTKKGHEEDTDETGYLCIGSVAICEKRAKEQAQEYGHSYEREINYLLVHGICHLLGYDHMTEEDKKEMRAIEERILFRAGLER